MEKSYHITFTGIVQGVGFRPYVHQLAMKQGLRGWVSNDVDGVHIEINADDNKKELFLQTILKNPPGHAVITGYMVQEMPHTSFLGFKIKESLHKGIPSLLLSPDIALCNNCRAELSDPENHRFNYPFTTCLQCGPRYSIIKSLPYDRPNTSMDYLGMCHRCLGEYRQVTNRRYYSQTNSCPCCTIQMQVYDKSGNEVGIPQAEVIQFITGIIKDGKIAAVKGIGGYLLLCDATNSDSIKLLRQRKHRPAKPFAIMYPSMEMLKRDTVVDAIAERELQGAVSPILLLPVRENNISRCMEDIAPGLWRIGAMLPYSPLLQLISSSLNRPLIATSGNLSGSPIIYKDEEARKSLSRFADFILCFDREIVAPQDDSVIQFTEGSSHKIILRRSRGLAPNYLQPSFGLKSKVLAMGGELKSSFAVYNGGNLFISQFLGNMESFESQQAFEKTLQHYLSLYQIVPEKVLIDSHPGYHISAMGREYAANWQKPVIAIQHHKAHFAAVLAEIDLLDEDEKVLGVIWDGTGYGDDGNIWGGEFFTFSGGYMERVAHLEYFIHLLSDKMSREPRLSALSLFGENEITHSKFSSNEYKVCKSSLVEAPLIYTSSMGRVLDAVASILGICDFNSYEGEAAMKLESLAGRGPAIGRDYYELSMDNGLIGLGNLTSKLLGDLRDGLSSSLIAQKVFLSLVKAIDLVAERQDVKAIACSGGVFQNALLVEMVVKNLGHKYKLYFHKNLSPNDECIGFGQLAYYYNDVENLKT